MLLDLTRPALTSQSRKLILVQQLNNDVLARSKGRTNGVVSSFVQRYNSMVASPRDQHEATTSATNISRRRGGELPGRSGNKRKSDSPENSPLTGKSWVNP